MLRFQAGHCDSDSSLGTVSYGRPDGVRLALNEMHFHELEGEFINLNDETLRFMGSDEVNKILLKQKVEHWSE